MKPASLNVKRTKKDDVCLCEGVYFCMCALLSVAVGEYHFSHHKITYIAPLLKEY